jgi:RNA polymerase sigma factor (sigma-70 family)
MVVAETMVSSDDSELVQRTLSGDREAFGLIVARYQALISSLAYSATGNLGQSEDLTQETFITAWTRLGHLRERNQLRPWLCGIARNRINNALRRDNREPIRHAEPLDAIQESAAPEPLPHDQAINNEEAAILWRSLEGIPSTYRTPLILFYREHQSVETVAEHLGLTADAVRQRLARGRKLLQDRILLFVESALLRSNPGKAFTLAVLASLPALAVSAKAAAVGATAVAGGTTAKTAGASMTLHALLGPLVVLVPNYLAYRVILAGAQSDAERASIKSFYGKVGMITLALFIPVAAIVLWLARNQPDPSFVSGLLATCLVLIFLPTFFILNIAFSRKCRLHCSRILAEEYAGDFPKPAWEFRSEAMFLGLPLVHIRIGDRFALLRSPVKAWIAIGHAAIGGLFALGAGAIAPISVGGFSIGLLSFGGLAIGGIALGGIAVGGWPLFGGLMIGWQAFNGCIAVGWSAAVGAFALANDYALGSYAHAAQANNELARQFIFANPLFQCAQFILRHWLWLHLLWIVPFFVVWRVARKPTCDRRAPERARETL